MKAKVYIETTIPTYFELPTICTPEELMGEEE